MRGLLRLMRRVLRRLKRMFSDGHAFSSYSQEGEDMILRRIFDGKATGFYVDVGAHHPRRFSNTYYFYKLGWRGINIEPNPIAIRLFNRQRSRDINIEAGVSDVPGTLTYFCFDDPALNTFNVELAAQRTKLTRYKLIEERPAPVLRLDTILRSNGEKDTPIDFLSVDVEGFDLQVLKSNAWTEFRPRCVLAESIGQSINDALTCELSNYMRAQGYELVAKTFNTLVFIDRMNGDRVGATVKPLNK